MPATHRPPPQVLHQARVNVEAEFDLCVEESRLADKLQDLEVMCEEQGVHDDGRGREQCGEEGGGGEAGSGGQQPPQAAAAAAPAHVLRQLQHQALQQENEVLRGQLEAEQERLRGLDQQLAALRAQAAAQQEALAKPGEVLQRVHEASRLWSNRVEPTPVF